VGFTATDRLDKVFEIGILLTVFDAVIVCLTTVEYRKRRHQTVAP